MQETVKPGTVAEEALLKVLLKRVRDKDVQVCRTHTLWRHWQSTSDVPSIRLVYEDAATVIVIIIESSQMKLRPVL